MAWRNILSLSGISGVGDTYEARGGSGPDAVVLVIEDGALNFTPGPDGANWYGFNSIGLGNFADLVEKPCNVRVTCTYEGANEDPHGYFLFQVGGLQNPADPNTGENSGEYTIECPMSDDPPGIVVSRYDASTPLAALSLVIETDGDDIGSEFWTNFKNSIEE